MKTKLYSLLDLNESSTKASKILNYSIIILIVLTVISIILQSFQSLYTSYNWLFNYFELFSVSIFTIEYVARVYVSNLTVDGSNSKKSRLTYIISPMAIVDLLAILPFFIPFIIPIDLRFLRILRLTRLLRVFKLNRYTKALKTIAKVIESRKDELLSSIFILSFVLLFSSILMYYAEFDAQPDAFPNIGASLWWAICTLTTVGYGDVYPITSFGKLIASVITVLGIGIIALPTAIISSGFLEEVQKRKNKQCPHCGGSLDE